MCQAFSLSIKGTAKGCDIPLPLRLPQPGAGVTPQLQAGVQHKPLCLAFPRMQTRFACLHFGAVLKAFSLGRLRLWRRSTSHTKLSLVATSSFPLQPGWCWTARAHKGQRRVSHSVPVPNNWLMQGSYPSTHGTSTTLVLIPSRHLSLSHSLCLLQPTDIFTQPIKSLQWMLNHLSFYFSASQTMLLWVENYLLPPLLPSLSWISFHLLLLVVKLQARAY